MLFNFFKKIKKDQLYILKNTYNGIMANISIGDIVYIISVNGNVCEIYCPRTDRVFLETRKTFLKMNSCFKLVSE